MRFLLVYCIHLWCDFLIILIGSGCGSRISRIQEMRRPGRDSRAGLQSLHKNLWLHEVAGRSYETRKLLSSRHLHCNFSLGGPGVSQDLPYGTPGKTWFYTFYNIPSSHSLAVYFKLRVKMKQAKSDSRKISTVDRYKLRVWYVVKVLIWNGFIRIWLSSRERESHRLVGTLPQDTNAMVKWSQLGDFSSSPLLL